MVYQIIPALVETVLRWDKVRGAVVMATEAAHGIQGKKRPPIAFAKPPMAAMVIAASDWSENYS